MRVNSGQLPISVLGLALAVAGEVLNLYIWRNPFLGTCATLLYVGSLLGLFWYPRTRGGTFERIEFPSLLLLALLFVNVFGFYFFRQNTSLAAVSLFVITGAAVVLRKFYGGETLQRGDQLGSTGTARVFAPWWESLSLVILSSLASFLFFWQLLQARSQHIYTGILPSPHVPYHILLLLLLFSIILALLRRNRTPVILFLFAAFLFVTSALYVAPLQEVYGSDLWRHIAVEKFVAEGNQYEPTDLFELLQLKSEKVPNGFFYSTMVSVHYYTSVPFTWLNRLGGALLFLPILVACFYGILRSLMKSSWSSLAMLGVLAIPATVYVSRLTTPHAFGLTTFFVAMWLWTRYIKGEYSPPLLRYGLTLFALLSYPTTGYFTLLFALISVITKRVKRLRTTVWFIPLIFFSGILLSFPVIYADIVLKHAPLAIQNEQTFFAAMHVIADWWQQLIAVTPSNPELLFLLLAIVGMVWLYRHAPLFFLNFSILLVTARVNLFLRGIFSPEILPPFSDRIFNIYWLLLAIPFAIGITLLWKEAKKGKVVQIVIAIIIIFLIIRANNPAAQVFGWSVSSRQVGAIQYIVEKAGAESYVVLTDEVTSAAGTAIAGFTNTAYYWYPGGVVYETYVSFVNEPTMNTLNKACHSLQTKKIFFIYTPIPLNTRTPDLLVKAKKIMEEVYTNNDTHVLYASCYAK